MRYEYLVRHWWSASLTCAALLSFQSTGTAAEGPPAPDSILEARAAWRFEPARRCPDLRIADEGPAAIVLFLVNTGGVPSRTSIKSSSRSDGLDAAAVNCVLKLRFQPATRPGDGSPLDSWQQMALTWARKAEPNDVPPGIAGRAAAANAEHSASAVTGTKEFDASGKPEGFHAKDGRVDVRVCADMTGKLAQDPKITRSSGDAGLDDAAVKIAASGSGYYRPASTLDGKPVSGCVQLAIKFERE